MSSEFDDKIRDHSYDGIQEYDNPMPSWWSVGFWASVVWAVVYVIAISVGAIDTYEVDLAQGQAEIEQLRRAHAGNAPKVEWTEANLSTAIAAPGVVEAGLSPYTTRCAPCHGDAGQGLVGPNLTDDAWLHGGTNMDIFRSVKDGVPAKGMPAWGYILTQDELIGVVAWIRAAQGTNPPGAKPAQGTPVTP